MTLVHRISRLFTADLHAMLDRLEEPEALLKQAVRDMEEAVAKNEQRVLLLEHQEMELERRLEAIRQALATVDAELDLCLARDEDALARTLVRRKLENEATLRALEGRQEETTRLLQQTRSLLDEQRRELDGVRQKVELIMPVRESSTSFGTEHAVSNDDVEIALLRERERRQPS